MTTSAQAIESGMAMHRSSFVAKPAGRPIDPGSEQSQRPWLAEGISQRTYYRRKADAVAAAPKPLEQHGSHVSAWFSSLGTLAQLEHRAFVRRCLIAVARP